MSDDLCPPWLCVVVVSAAWESQGRAIATGSTKPKRTTPKTKDSNPGNLIATMHIGVVQGNNSLLSTDPLPSCTIPSLEPVDSSVVSIAKILETPDTGKQYSSDEGNTRQQSTSMATTTSLNSTTHKKSNYYLKKIAMQEDCVESESPASTSATVSPIVSPSAPVYPPQSTTMPPLPLETFIDLNPSFDYQDGNTK
ncbi:hypothetical protein Cantr_05779 [Candida viswanathii]|uniref:Uncharacterized protein n=1 Tax=Candida viswanathii TaxID=5486 RepID=A0A367XQS0_9ASCO|nr:hypothetical protein Cantr_05779 [Candida viswanathii]